MSLRSPLILAKVAYKTAEAWILGRETGFKYILPPSAETNIDMDRFSLFFPLVKPTCTRPLSPIALCLAFILDNEYTLVRWVRSGLGAGLKNTTN